jgi:hypothetical protein
MGGFDDLAKSLMGDIQQNRTAQEGGQVKRTTYPAVVVRADDPLEQGRIIARIVSLDEAGNMRGGRDKDTPDDKLPFAVPLVPGFFHVTPLEGEMVILVMENPEINTSPRYWIGPLINSKLKLKYQSYREAIKIFDYTRFGVNQNISSRPSPSRSWPEKSDVALMGRDDSMVLLKPREVYINSGTFKKGTFDPNLEHPSFLQMRQFDVKPDGQFNTNPIEYSQTNLVSTNVNLYSPRGKFRKSDSQRFEVNPDLQNFGETALTLHPAVLGDELVKLLDLMVQFMRTHVHTPQNPPVPGPLLKRLEEYTVSGKLQDILSNHIRLN